MDKKVWYAELWESYKAAQSDHERLVLGSLMDKCQNEFEYQEFQDFKVTLPGFLGFWQGWADRAKMAIKDTFEPERN